VEERLLLFCHEWIDLAVIRCRFVLSKIPITCLSGEGVRPSRSIRTPSPTPLPYDGEREHTECAALTCPRATAYTLELLFPLLETIGNNGLAPATIFYTCRLLFSLAPKYRPRGRCDGGEESGPQGPSVRGIRFAYPAYALQLHSSL
jgi:hypothetical protein